MWMLLEPVHALLYYAPEALAEAAAAGYDTSDRWQSYFAWRAAPLGAAGRRLVTASFYSFSPAKVARYVPAAWEVASAGEALASRLRAVDSSLRTVWGDEIGSAALAEAAKLARTAADACDTTGRVLAAANQDLPWPDEPHLALWQASMVLREHRGDGHVAALLTAGLDGCESLVSFAAVGAAPVATFGSREWTAEEWQAATERLTARGWLNPDGTATPLAHETRAEIERTTDALAASPWEALGPEATRRLVTLTAPLTTTIVKAGILPGVSTLGIRPPAADRSPAAPASAAPASAAPGAGQ
jgi:hypothetical protein